MYIHSIQPCSGLRPAKLSEQPRLGVKTVTGEEKAEGRGELTLSPATGLEWATPSTY